MICLARNRKLRISGDLAQCILLILRKEGAQPLLQLQEKTALQTSGLHNQTGERRARSETLCVASTCDDLVRKELIKLSDNAAYELTAVGRVQAEEIASDMESLVHRIETQISSPSAAARNATAGYLVLAVLKMSAGFFSGSVGLIADGADTTVDTASSGIVWAGIKFKKDTLGTVIILGLMFLTAAILFYDSANSDNSPGTWNILAHIYAYGGNRHRTHSYAIDVCPFALSAGCGKQKPEPCTHIPIYRLQKQRLLLGSCYCGRNLLYIWHILGRCDSWSIHSC